MLYKDGEDLVSVSNSILKAYGLPLFHSSYIPLDRLLKKNGVPKKKVCLMLLDGFGSSIQFIYRKEAPFIYSHRKYKITSVFPPTTAAATTSLLTGKYPKETGWMGWTQKFEKWDKPVTVFRSSFISESPDEEPQPTPEKITDLMPTVQLDQMINQAGHYRADKIMGFLLNPCDSASFFAETERKLNSGLDFLYSYWCDPDTTLHEYGVGSQEAGDCVADLDRRLEELVARHPDVLFILLADHGHINTEYIPLADYPDVCSLLRFPDFGMETRAPSFYVKEGKEKEFRALAEKYFGEDFFIYSRAEVIKKRIFGLGKEESPYYRYTIGDFLFISKGRKAFSQPSTHVLKSNHAGGTAQERFINVAVFNGLA
jgi:hypothetical protein